VEIPSFAAATTTAVSRSSRIGRLGLGFGFVATMFASVLKLDFQRFRTVAGLGFDSLG